MSAPEKLEPVEAPPPLPDDFFELLESLITTPAGTGKEERRARFIEDWLRRETSFPVVRNHENCVIVDLRRSSHADQPALLLDAHLDTVFPDESLSVRKEGDIWHAPGANDNTCSVALLMTLVREWDRQGVTLPLIACATSGEESFGNLRGIRSVIEEWRPQISGVLAMDMGLQRYCIQGPGNRRWKFTFKARGGHSWNDFGQANPVVEVARMTMDLEQAFSWKHHEDSFNVILHEAGQVPSCIAGTARGELEIRSLNEANLIERETWVTDYTQQRTREVPGLEIYLESNGSRPAGNSSPDDPLVLALHEVHDGMNLPLELTIASTNANLPASLGIPAVCTGFFKGGNIHTYEEFLDTSTIKTGWIKLWNLTTHLASRT